MTQADVDRVPDLPTAHLRQFFRALGSVTRLRILGRLARVGEVNVTILTQGLRRSQPLISWHLSVLRRAGLVQMRRAGREALYSLNREKLDWHRAQFARLLDELDRAD